MHKVRYVTSLTQSSSSTAASPTSSQASSSTSSKNTSPTPPPTSSRLPTRLRCSTAAIYNVRSRNWRHDFLETPQENPSLSYGCGSGSMSTSLSTSRKSSSSSLFSECPSPASLWSRRVGTKKNQTPKKPSDPKAISFLLETWEEFNADPEIVHYKPENDYNNNHSLDSCFSDTDYSMDVYEQNLATKILQEIDPKLMKKLFQNLI